MLLWKMPDGIFLRFGLGASAIIIAVVVVVIIIIIT